jgi:hypothetical protein
MSIYDRGDSTGAAVAAEWENGRSWIAHPGEEAQRASHALGTAEGVWLIDPIDAPDLETLIDPLGEVAGVAVLSCWHGRDAGALARRYDVPVHIPEWMGRIEERVDAPIQRYTLAPGDAGFHAFPCRPFPGWQEAFLYHEPGGTLVVPESIGTVDPYLVDDERVGLNTVRRLQPPRELAGLEPDRILVGHGSGVTEDAAEALDAVLDGARATFPDALVENGSTSLRAMLGALR